ncbi:alpha/beta fold hydrolase [Streptomyces antnestii]|uniref:Alpha/beta fold hydrolase n=1 Tax=Streptomyces antnestii TaxID=2494256 RepID=A0A3S3UJ11_9ACTN|nr:alpha/beta fold hydrolase [Streptomyces sp. San01]RVU27816.1 alpha/beta fold hydrolase [Streptomyces sp. San01]
MTAFILVAGAHTGGWVWDEVAAGLSAAGAQAYAVTLTGMDAEGSRQEAEGIELATHVEELVRIVDGVEAPDVVLVGHCYGIHPVRGAADRRPGRIARIVHVDVGIPRDGDPALALVPDQAVRERVMRLAGDDGGDGDGDGSMPPPGPGEWQRWGSAEGLSEEALARLAERAVPQPLATLTRPLRLTGAASELPTTGILCTANGSSIAVVEAMVGMGDPAFQALADPHVSFFELATGHWPMLSAPRELVEVLLLAAAGEGHRVGAEVRERPAHLRPFLMDVKERPRERTGRVDLHLPDAEGPRPAVLFVHGGPVHAAARPTPRDWPAFVGYGQYVAGLGAVGATVDHGLHDLTAFGRAADDVAGAVELVRADPRVDGDRVALWFLSAGGLLAADWLRTPPPWLRCVAASYPVLAPLPGWGLSGDRFRPVSAVGGAGRLPIVLTRVGLERPEIAVTVEEFVAAADDCGAAVEVIDLPRGHHGFETADPTAASRDAVERAVRSVLGHLGERPQVH